MIHITIFSARFVKFVREYGLPLFFLLVYILFPAGNSTIDGWGYAEEIKYGYNLFRPHHLLYNAFGFMLIKTAHLFNLYPDVLSTLKVLNAVTATLILVTLGRILLKMQLTAGERNLWLFFAGSSFGVWRFATENEVYLLPILFSLAGSYCFLLFLHDNKAKNLALSSVFASLACLFHQLHIFWWLALLTGLLSKRTERRNILIYLSVAIIIPLTYMSVLFFYEKASLTAGNIASFVLHDYITGSAEASVDFRNLLLTPVSLFRTFFQFHGNILLLIRKFPWLYGILFTSVTLAVSSLYMFRKIRFRTNPLYNTFFKIHLLAFSLHLLFAFFAHGNAEFMVVLVVIIPLLINQLFLFSPRALLLISLSMFIWNFSFAIFPNYHFNFNNDEEVISFIRQHPEGLFILKEKNIIANRYYYETGIPVGDRIYGYPLEKHLSGLCALQADGIEIYSDLLSKKSPLSRASLLEGKGDEHLEMIEEGIDRIPSFYGEFTIDKVGVKCEK